MRRKALGAVGAAALALGVIAPGVATAAAGGTGNGNGVSGCHAYVLHYAKDLSGTNSTKVAATDNGVTVQGGQELISSICGQS